MSPDGPRLVVAGEILEGILPRAKRAVTSPLSLVPPYRATQATSTKPRELSGAQCADCTPARVKYLHRFYLSLLTSFV